MRGTSADAFIFSLIGVVFAARELCYLTELTVFFSTSADAFLFCFSGIVAQLRLLPAFAVSELVVLADAFPRFRSFASAFSVCPRCLRRERRFASYGCLRRLSFLR